MKRGRETSLIVDRLGRELPVERLLAGELDFAIGFGPGYHRLHPDLQWESVLSDTFVCLTASRKLAPSTRVSLDEFCDMEHVFHAVGIRAQHDRRLARKLGRSRSIVARANTYQACLNIVARLPVALTLPRRLIQHLSIPANVQICEVPSASRPSRWT
jgi:DNA-binding transcriptional LysR family regulator